MDEKERRDSGSQAARAAGALAAVAVFALGACGGGGGTTEAAWTPSQQEVVSAAGEYRQAFLDRDPERICDLSSEAQLIAQAREVEIEEPKLGSRLCARAVGRDIDENAQVAERPFEVTEVSVKGDSASVGFTLGGDEGTWNFVMEGDAEGWEYDGGGLAAPSGE